MKTKQSLVWTLLLLLPLAAQAGREGNGGDPMAFEFEQSARGAIRDIRASAGEYPGIKAAELAAVLAKTKIVIVNEALLAKAGDKSQESAALNYPDTGTIYLNRARWTEIKSDEIRKALALHELLGLSGKEETGSYPISQQYLARRGVACQETLCLSPPRELGFSFSEAERLFRDGRMPEGDELKAAYLWVAEASVPGYDVDPPNNWFNPQGAATLELKTMTSFSGAAQYHSANFIFQDKGSTDYNLTVTLNPAAKAACFSYSAGSLQQMDEYGNVTIFGKVKTYFALQCRTLATDANKLICAQTLVVHPDETGTWPQKFNRKLTGYLAFARKAEKSKP